MKFFATYISKTSDAQLKIKIQAKRLKFAEFEPFLIDSEEERNSWCLSGKPCAQYGKKPCCPPKAKLFRKYKKRKYIYVFSARMRMFDYYREFPNVYDSKWCGFLALNGSRVILSRLMNKIVVNMCCNKDDQGFRVSWCSGCQYDKTKKCKNYKAPLESAGVNVCKLHETLFKGKIQWVDTSNKNKNYIMTAVGAVYTDAIIPKETFIKKIQEVFM